MISHQHKVIFVHIPKTGGQSVEHMFLDDLGLSWEERAPLLLRPNQDPKVGPRRMAHLYADEYVSKGHVTQEQFDSYLKFAVVRNPYDRIISEYLYRFQKTPFWKTPSAARFLKRTYPDDFSDTARHMMPQTRYVMDANGKLLVDHILRFEEMGEAMADLSEQIFGTRRSLPHRNKTKVDNKAKKAKLRKTLQPQIAQMYQEDFEAFDYPV
ncbi:sulfotransferase family 2 domain-containing protein [uncultured Roseobacter sp.]|uniref:sulfotransferase family 2 domain-containing protein n=1 Tax=uncultured Roseobacter sp. TaxID=114847 RepID=UPI002607F8D7|nr:sulfotransferase family 2 domain-containing protein [uncultured Roseobacter sp.]